MGVGSKLSLPLEQAYKWERAKADELYLTQPMGEGQVQEYTWNRAVGEARRMASYLKSLELPPKSNIAILSKNCAHWIMTDLAIWMAGHVTVPLYPTLNSETVRYILEHSDSKILFVGKLDEWDEMKPGVPADLPCISYPLSPENDFPSWDEIVTDHAPLKEETQRDAQELATIVYTSGSTGKPKGVMVSFEAMAIAAKGVAEALEMKDTERMLSYLPLAHVFERYAVEQASLHIGFHVYFAEALDTFLQDLQRARPTVFISVPRLWAKFQLGVFQKMPPEKLKFLLSIPILSSIVKKKVLKNLGLDHCHFAVSGSAPLSGEIINWYRGLGLELMEGYGMSENFAYSHISLPGRSRVGYVGEPLPGVEQRISEKGEIEIRSPASMMGYYKDDEKTRESFTEDGFLLTGDKGEIDELGRLKITGRIKEIFKTSKGKYVAPAPIENMLMASDALEVVCVAGAECPQPYAMAVLSEQFQGQHKDPSLREKLEPAIEALIQKVNSRVDHHEALQFIVIVSDTWGIENDFLTPTMKIKRDVIEKYYENRVTGWQKQKKPIVWD
ncbi:AMP-binding acetyl-CoA synthetase [Oleiphilus sp. HI0071]|uniref:AMP-binding protein n=1 Tax=Oleiphilus sp. HI0080 TaxID=1822255 RepID=UPI0007C327F9|nr:AMP-binding protein [Oleiphilus sp. HI0080]KZY63994.1 AMP-binding acetyl-CoA synthetase [Oleiphilus sp. HI0065]KZY90211.1 AMP-binding acetyl-CoA synthetase [Oleiphilus sp. HI0071]KZZ06126.1 AMP-binding acetyl-CoA synthetase [Oleiphilus sp. HI0073]KZZ40155.1 AMP-binding acetyl-CoA synthetase [Oleiphilus sp. HI0118]KZZ51939.1 AMP-binding acetyl-CoA synthetase [Oleiphilus sp. HI0122]